MDLNEPIAFGRRALADVSSRLTSNDIEEVFWAVTRLARMRYYREADLADTGAEILLSHGEKVIVMVIPYLGRNAENLRLIQWECLAGS
jgi:NaMN:DMB phosphoribosyltransferase